MTGLLLVLLLQTSPASKPPPPPVKQARITKVEEPSGDNALKEINGQLSALTVEIKAIRDQEADHDKQPAQANPPNSVDYLTLILITVGTGLGIWAVRSERESVRLAERADIFVTDVAWEDGDATINLKNFGRTRARNVAPRLRIDGVTIQHAVNTNTYVIAPDSPLGVTFIAKGITMAHELLINVDYDDVFGKHTEIEVRMSSIQGADGILRFEIDHQDQKKKSSHLRRYFTRRGSPIV